MGYLRCDSIQRAGLSRSGRKKQAKTPENTLNQPIPTEIDWTQPIVNNLNQPIVNNLDQPIINNLDQPLESGNDWDEELSELEEELEELLEEEFEDALSDLDEELSHIEEALSDLDDALIDELSDESSDELSDESSDESSSIDGEDNRDDWGLDGMNWDHMDDGMNGDHEHMDDGMNWDDESFHEESEQVTLFEKQSEECLAIADSETDVDMEDFRKLMNSEQESEP